MTDMAELVTVTDARRARGTVRYLKANGFHDVALWPKDMLDSSIGILGGGPLPLELPFRLKAKSPQGPFVIAVPADLIPQAYHQLSLPDAAAEIERLSR